MLPSVSVSLCCSAEMWWVFKIALDPDITHLKEKTLYCYYSFPTYWKGSFKLHPEYLVLWIEGPSQHYGFWYCLWMKSWKFIPVMPWEGLVPFYADSFAKKYWSWSQEYSVRKMGNAWAVWLNAVFCFSHFFLRACDSLLLVMVSFTASRSIMDTHLSSLVPEIWGDFLHQWLKELTTSPQPLLSMSLFTVFCFHLKLNLVCNCSVNSFYQKLWTKLQDDFS